ncbi:MAG: endolytic transglycosylase MltG [Elusimicrobiota bacterium]|jgi:UPF0755 protein|nr:endolytic transglycosylase MltG [Elusimicrobiota bacterium]
MTTLKDIVISRTEHLGLSYKQLMILASIIELEGASFEDKRKVSAVFHNRLKNNMKLQSCATINYIRKKHGVKHKLNLNTSDTLIESYYNTYKYHGLPPGQICKPKIYSVYAALFPYENERILFFRANKSRTKNIFSENLEDHLKIGRSNK